VTKISGEADGNMGAHTLSLSASAVPKLSGEADGNMGAHTLSLSASSVPKLSGEADGSMGAHTLSLSASSVPPLTVDPSGNLGTHTLSSSTSSVPKLPGDADGLTGALTFSSSASSAPKLYGEAEGNSGEVLARLVVLEREIRALSLDTDNKITASGNSVVDAARQIAEWCTCKVEEAASSFSASLQTEVRRGTDTLMDSTVTRFHDLLHSQIDQVTSKLTKLVTDRCNELSERIGSLAVDTSPPPNVADSYHGQHSSWDEAGTQNQAVFPDIGAFTAENLAGLTGLQTLAIGRCKTPGEAKDVIRRARTPCSYFFSGSCKFGDRCAFFHGDDADAETASTGDVEQETGIGVGDVVEIHGLANAQELNGRHGMVIRFVESSQRFEVILDGDTDSKGIRLVNLKKVSIDQV